jgi:hypothetical protein
MGSVRLLEDTSINFLVYTNQMACVKEALYLLLRREEKLEGLGLHGRIILKWWSVLDSSSLWKDK